MLTTGSVASVIAAIREDAAADVDRLEQATAAEVESVRAEGKAAPVAIADRAQRVAAERRTAAERVAQQEWDGRRAMIEQREAWIARVIAAARERWRPDMRVLNGEARERLGDDCVIREQAGGCVATKGDVSFDNTLDARARRFEPEWRNALAALYAVSRHPERSEGPGRSAGAKQTTDAPTRSPGSVATLGTTPTEPAP